MFKFIKMSKDKNMPCFFKKDSPREWQASSYVHAPAIWQILIKTKHKIVDGIIVSVIFSCDCSLDFLYKLFVLHIKQS